MKPSQFDDSTKIAKIVDIDSSAMFAEKKICKLFFSDNHSSCPLVDKF